MSADPVGTTGAEPAPVPDWALVRRMMDADGRPRAWRSVGLWALDVLADEMGGDWPARWWAKQGQLPPELVLGTYLPAAFACLRHRTGPPAARWGPPRGAHTAHRRPARARVAWPAVRDRRRDGGPPGRADNAVDVTLTVPDRLMGVETFVVLKDQGTRVAQSYVYELSRRLDEVCWSLGVEIDGALEVRMSPEDTDRWLHNMLPR